MLPRLRTRSWKSSLPAAQHQVTVDASSGKELFDSVCPDYGNGVQLVDVAQAKMDAGVVGRQVTEGRVDSSHPALVSRRDGDDGPIGVTSPAGWFHDPDLQPVPFL